MSARVDLLRLLRADVTRAEDWAGAESLWDEARDEGVLPLLLETVARSGWPGVRRDLRASLTAERDAEAARAELRRGEVQRVLAHLAAAGIRALVIKGVALAWRVYPHPAMRPSIDVDLLISEPDVDAARRLFESLGGTLIPHVTGRLVMSQFHYETIGAGGLRHTFDVHWRAVNPLAFSAIFPGSRAFEGAVRVESLGRHARTLSDADALLLACVHRAAHHRASRRLIWLYDIHLLAGRIDGNAGAGVVVAAREGRALAVLQDGIAAAHDAFGGEALGALRERLLKEDPAGPELTKRYLDPSCRDVEGAALDLVAAGGCRPRVRYIRELLLPSPEYMRSGYPRRSGAPLPVLYAARLFRGAVRWLKARRG